MMKTISKLFLALILVFSLAGAGLGLAAQQGNGLELRLVRNFGYGGLGRIQGNFTLQIVNPPSTLEEVVIYLDEQPLESVSQPPFQVQFSTGDYAPGERQLSARGTLVDGSQLESAVLTKTFLSSDQAWSETQGILVPLLVGVGLLTLLGLGVPALLSRNKEFVPGRYGPGGGAVCPRCELPFSRPVWAPNLVAGQLVRCPHCGKISLLARASTSRLEDAERKYQQREGGSPPGSEKEHLQKMLEESRYED